MAIERFSLKLYNAGSEVLTLVDTWASGYCSREWTLTRIRASAQKPPQISRPFRAAVVPRNRGGLLRTVAFTVERVRGSSGEAIVEAAGPGEDVEAVTFDRVDFQSEVSGSITLRRYTAAAWVGADVETIGKSTITTYTFSFGATVKATSDYLITEGGDDLTTEAGETLMTEGM